MKSLSDQFTDWVEQQDPEAEYDYDDVCGCAFYRFLDAAGYPVERGLEAGASGGTGTATSAAPTSSTTASLLACLGPSAPSVVASPSSFQPPLSRLRRPRRCGKGRWSDG